MRSRKRSESVRNTSSTEKEKFLRSLEQLQITILQNTKLIPFSDTQRSSDQSNFIDFPAVHMLHDFAFVFHFETFTKSNVCYWLMLN